MRRAAKLRALAGCVLVAAAATGLACAEGPTTVSIAVPTGTIAGRVLDTRGAPVPGVNISVLPFVPGTTTDAKGRFVLEELPIETEYRVSALKPGYTSSSVNVPVSKAQLFFSVEFTLFRLGS